MEERKEHMLPPLSGKLISRPWWVWWKWIHLYKLQNNGSSTYLWSQYIFHTLKSCNCHTVYAFIQSKHISSAPTRSLVQCLLVRIKWWVPPIRSIFSHSPYMQYITVVINVSPLNVKWWEVVGKKILGPRWALSYSGGPGSHVWAHT